PAAKRKMLFGAEIIALAAFIIILNRSRSPGIQRFVSIEGGGARDLKEILKKTSTGVYESETPGIVVWSLPRSEPLSRYSVEARQFALDSDLIIGAVASQQQVTVIARERVVPLSLLPPLRTETIMMLASAETDE